MPTFPVELLTNQALCDAALADIQTELDDLMYRQTNYAHRDGKASTRATEINEEIQTLDSDIAKYNVDIPAMTAGSKNRLKREAELRAAVKRRGDLGASLTTGPVAAFRVAVDLVQVVRSIAALNEAKTEVTAQRAVVPA